MSTSVVALTADQLTALTTALTAQQEESRMQYKQDYISPGAPAPN